MSEVIAKAGLHIVLLFRAEVATSQLFKDQLLREVTHCVYSRRSKDLRIRIKFSSCPSLPSTIIIYYLFFLLIFLGPVSLRDWPGGVLAAGGVMPLSPLFSGPQAFIGRLFAAAMLGMTTLQVISSANRHAATRGPGSQYTTWASRKQQLWYQTSGPTIWSQQG